MLPSEEPTLRSANGRLVLTADALEVDGQGFALLELDAVELKPIRWLLWFLLGGITLAGFALAFLQNWLRTVPAALGLTAGALLLAYGSRGTNRLRLYRAGREALHFALAGDPLPWQKLAAEANRRIQRRHEEAAAAAVAAWATDLPPTESDTGSWPEPPAPPAHTPDPTS
ncbi:hypothetical protein GCM10011375_16540 [Hymenobacter qilianensis]|uniref:Uncharacterized protein n=2 Tax=Hymenobacter qilianensis TaxID=1385715 RepID=A0ACB5PQK0_9BACT|nr:hypothetical protein [Hymenobacter qilianensis]QNP51858.1 hypothetical protein H9L05_18250 [Hymenobacter qilianensis]GGF62259.1 hypothetical protein GCM10011375_16540 [Hymenobacter qilianensis]